MILHPRDNKMLRLLRSNVIYLNVHNNKIGKYWFTLTRLSIEMNQRKIIDEKLKIFHRPSILTRKDVILITRNVLTTDFHHFAALITRQSVNCFVSLRWSRHFIAYVHIQSNICLIWRPHESDFQPRKWPHLFTYGRSYPQSYLRVVIPSQSIHIALSIFTPHSKCMLRF